MNWEIIPLTVIGLAAGFGLIFMPWRRLFTSARVFMPSGKVVMGTIAVLAIVGIAWFAWNSFGKGVEVFDPKTGAVQLMIDPTTGTIDSQGRTLSDCAKKACFSAETGKPLVVMTEAQATAYERSTAGSALTNVEATLSRFLRCKEQPPIIVEDGARITVTRNCPVVVDQRTMREGMDFVLVDPKLRAMTGNQQLVTMSAAPSSDIITFNANRGGYDRLGVYQLEVELYRAGTGEKRVAEKHGVHTPAIDLAP